MENENNTYFQNYIGFDFMSRKGRGKKKRKPKKNRSTALNSSEDVKSESEISNTLEAAGDSNVTDENSSEVEDAEEDSNKDDVILKINTDRTLYRNGSGVSLDAMVKSPPVYEIVDKISLIENESLKSSVETTDKLNIEDIPICEGSNEQYSIINTRALPKEAPTYKLETFEKNALIIFNQEKIDGHLPRLGTQKDVESLTRTFENFGFEVKAHDDLTKDEVFKELKTCKYIS